MEVRDIFHTYYHVVRYPPTKKNKVLEHYDGMTR